MKIDTPFEQLLFNTIRIRTDLSDGGQSIGTGFIYEYEEEKKKYQFIVSNRHVIDNAKKGYLVFTESEKLNKAYKPILGKKFTLEINNFEKSWYKNKNADIDIAIMPFTPIIKLLRKKHKKKVFYTTIMDMITVKSKDIDELDAFENVYFVGYPNGLWDSKNNLPILRSGNTASPISIDYNGKPVFLIDASVFPGSSGSPVFLIDKGGRTDRKGNLIIGKSRVTFLGILSSAYFHSAVNPVLDISKKQGVLIEEMIDIGVVFKANMIQETITEFLEYVHTEKPKL